MRGVVGRCPHPCTPKVPPYFWVERESREDRVENREDKDRVENREDRGNREDRRENRKRRAKTKEMG